MTVTVRRGLSMAMVIVLEVAIVGVGAGSAGASSDVGFGKSFLAGSRSTNPTTLQFGPDGRLYVGQIDGAINVYSISRLGRNRYEVTATDTITRVAHILNHDDDGTPRPDVAGRLVTGLLVVGTPSRPVLYVSSSDPRFGGSNYGGDVGLDTNSGTVTRVRWDGSQWRSRELVRGLPRSEEVHATNGLVLDPATHTLYVAEGGNTNMGAPSFHFAELPEYALSGAILSVDLSALGPTPYDLPTLNDPTRAGNPDANDPFGGNDGLNQAKLVPGGPVQVFSPGYRNPYDLVLADNGRLYGTDNGSNAGVGGTPVGEGTPSCTNDLSEGGITGDDSLHLIEAGDYGGHPNPTRASTANTFAGQSPVSVGDPAQCDWLTPGPERGSLTTFPESTDGIAQYTASNFSGAMAGDLLTTTLGDNLAYRIELNPAGNAVVSKTSLFSNIDKKPLDLTTQGDDGLFPGTIWVADQTTGRIIAFEPNDYGGTPGPCSGLDDPSLDDDADGFSNADEIDNGTDPCSAGDVPPDADGDRISDRNDPDDDDDALPDTSDPFAVDPANGATTTLPVRLTWDPGSPAQGGLGGSGFTGLMTNGSADYESLFDLSAMTVGSATGSLTVDAVPPGTAHGSSNSQRFGFQLGLHVDPAMTGQFRVQTRIVAPFAGEVPKSGQSMGLMLGTGGQDDYVELSTTAGDGSGAVEFRREIGGNTSMRRSTAVAMPGPDAVDLTVRVDPAARTVQPMFAVESGGSVGPTSKLGAPATLPASWFSSDALAIGLISTSRGSGDRFPASWDSLVATQAGGGAARTDAAPPGSRVASPTDLATQALGSWHRKAPTGLPRGEVSFARAGDRFYLAWGGNAHQVYNPTRDRWRSLARLPDELNHIQSVTLHGRIYSIGGLRLVPGQPKPSVGTVWIYDPSTDAFSSGAPMPAGRERGAGGVAAWGGKLYYFGGLHEGVAVPWVDVYDPVADSWTSLPDMPRARDHFQAAIVDGTMYAIGGRAGDPLSPFGYNDAYDLATGTWTTGLAPLPTPRGGYAVAVVQGHILVIGGEGGGGVFATVEAYDPAADTWSALADMPTARHGIQAVVWHGHIFVAAGGARAGGGAPTDVNQVFLPPAL
jgi:glucose/arabinose dehydrogenase/N-acetylneuraminic acid mutarotase